jgi:hypothetical protein
VLPSVASKQENWRRVSEGAEEVMDDEDTGSDEFSSAAQLCAMLQPAACS